MGLVIETWVCGCRTCAPRWSDLTLVERALYRLARLSVWDAAQGEGDR